MKPSVSRAFLEWRAAKVDSRQTADVFVMDEEGAAEPPKQP
jgi:hypothetical protein